jgi:glutamate synthase (NADPH) large chain
VLLAVGWMFDSLYQPQFEKDGCGVGLVARPDGRALRSVVESGLEILARLAHRGAFGADARTSDGAGLLTAVPHEFFRSRPELHAGLKDEARFAVAQVFEKKSQPGSAIDEFTRLAPEFGCRILAVRAVPVERRGLGKIASLSEPNVIQIFLSVDGDLLKLRRAVESGESRHGLYVCSLSSDTIVYKGLVPPSELAQYFVDLAHPEFTAAFAIVHSRFSTNTLPAWPLAHPFRSTCHNGEINTLRGNLAWMRARNKAGADCAIPTGLSDSASLDHAVEILKSSGRSVAEALMILIPQAWELDEEVAPSVRDFYRYHASRMEPWDGPAAVCFADARHVGATLDRSGLRPCRYSILADGTLILASETGALVLDPTDPERRVVTRGRLGPGQMIAVDLLQKRIVFNETIKRAVSRDHDFASLNKSEFLELSTADDSLSPSAPEPNEERILFDRQRFAVSDEEVRMVLSPMFASGEEPTSSMGNDTPLAVLSEHPQLLFKYFRQGFAQVTNPPIDPIREALVMSLSVNLGARPMIDLASQTACRVLSPCSSRFLTLKSPILSHSDLAGVSRLGFKVTKLELAFEHQTLEESLSILISQAKIAAANGTEVLILSDQNGSLTIPSLLAVASVHHALISDGLRMNLSLVVETGEARDVHHFACLFGFGADAVHPYLAMQIAHTVDPTGVAHEKFKLAIGKGLLTVMSKMGISCLRSYCGAQVFEAIGLSQTVIDQSFPGTVSRVGGLDYKDIERETRERVGGLWVAGEIHYRQDGERHVWNPTTIAKLQHATRTKNLETFREFSVASDLASRGSLRGLLKFKKNVGKGAAPVPIENVEPAASIVKRFTTGAMSFGSLGREAHETLAIAMNRIGGKSNSGEGGESAERFVPLANGDRKNSKIKQVASARFGVTAHYLSSAVELQIKVAQGAKPGEGGKLPGYKVDGVIAKLRHSTAGVTLISPPPHHDIYSIEDLAQLIFDLRRANPDARISVKLVACAGVGTIAAGVVKAGADKILISGDGGGTGASPLSSIKSAGAPWELGLSEAQQTLVLHGLRSRVLVEADGQMRTAQDVAIAACLGAEEFGFSTAPLIVEGCLMMRKCHLNTCPVGVATQDPELRAKFLGQPEHLVNYFFFIANELRILMSQIGVTSVDELVGRTDLLEQIQSSHWKSRNLDLSRLLQQTASAVPGAATERRRTITQVRVPDLLDESILKQAAPAFASTRELAPKIELDVHVTNEDRAIGTSLSYKVAKQFGATGLPPNTIAIRCHGVAGQSFGAFLARGLKLCLFGEANDYVGKGLSGGTIVVRPREAPASQDATSVIAGNACFYGATGGEAFVRGATGERFAVRNSGADVVVESVGDHGCEYMTGGRVIVIGPTGRNFAAGMSGGQAFVFDETDTLSRRLGPADLEIRRLESASETNELKRRIERHVLETESFEGRRLLNQWSTFKNKFWVLTPIEYKRALTSLAPQNVREVEYVG